MLSVLLCFLQIQRQVLDLYLEQIIPSLSFRGWSTTVRADLDSLVSLVGEEPRTFPDRKSSCRPSVHVRADLIGP